MGRRTATPPPRTARGGRRGRPRTQPSAAARSPVATGTPDSHDDSTGLHDEGFAGNPKTIGDASKEGQSSRGHSPPPASPVRSVEPPSPAQDETDAGFGQATAAISSAPPTAPPPPVSTFAALVDQNAGTTLSYFSPDTINGAKCAKLSKDDVEPEVQYWNTAVLCTVLGANPPLEVMEGYIRRVWGSKDLDTISMAKRGVFLVRFHTVEAQKAILNRGYIILTRNRCWSGLGMPI